MRVMLRHDQYQALGEILTELPDAADRYNRNFRAYGDRYTSHFQRLYAASRCNSTATWTDGGMIPYHWLLSVWDNQAEELGSLLLGAEALLRLLCETVTNFKALWLKCLNALSALCSMPETETKTETQPVSSLLRA